MNTEKIGQLAWKIYVNFLSPAAPSVRGPRFAPIVPHVIEYCGDLAEVRVRTRGSIEAAIISAAAPGPDHHLGQFVPLDLVLGWRGLAEPLGRLALGRVEHSYGDNGERGCTTQQPANLPWLLAFLCFAPGCPPLSLEDCRPGRVIELHGFECDIATANGEWCGRNGERSMLLYVTAWRFSRWWGTASSDLKKTSSHRAGAGGLINQQLTDLTRS
jgi:hypothetical protein